MGVGGITGPTGSYNPPSPTLSSINADLSVAQTQYTAASNAVDVAFADYAAKKNAVSAAPPAGLAVAIAVFEISRQIYYNTVGDFKTAACHLIDIKGFRLQFLDDTTDSAANALISQLGTLVSSGIIDTALYNQMASSIANLVSYRSDMRNALNSLMENEPFVVQARLDLVKLQDDAYIAFYNGDTATYNQRTNIDIPAQQGVITDLVATRNSLLTQVDSLTTTFDFAYANLSSLFQQEGLSLPTTVQNFNDIFAAAQQEALDMFAAIKQQIEDDDANLLDLFQATNASIISAIQGGSSAAYTQAQIVQHTTLASGLSDYTPVDITFPKIAAGQILSMNDLMRFITLAQRYISELRQKASDADSRIQELRMKIFSAYFLAASTDSSGQLTSFTQLIQSASEYQSLSLYDNQSRYLAMVAAVNNINDHLPEINAAIDEANAEIDQFNSDAVDVTDSINDIGPQIADTINSANITPADSVNYLDLFGVEPDPGLVGLPASAPALLPNPPLRDHVGTHISAISTPIPIFDINNSYDLGIVQAYHDTIGTPTSGAGLNPAPSNMQTPSEADVNALNAAIEEINKILYPIRDKLGPPINYEFIEPLVYRSAITFPDLGAVDASAFVEAFAGYFVSIIFQSLNSSRNRKSLKEEIGAAFAGIYSGFVAPKTPNNRGIVGAGSGIGITSADAAVSPGRMADLLSELMLSQTFRNFITGQVDKASLLAGIQVAGRPPTLFKNYSIQGVIRDNSAQQKVAEQSVTEAQLSAVGTNIFAAVKNPSVMLTNALELLAKTLKNQELTKKEIEALLKLIAFLQQLLLLLLGVLAAAAGGTSSSEELANNIKALVATSSATTSSSFISSDSSNAIGSLFQNAGYSSDVSNSFTALLNGTGSPLAVATLNSNAFNLPTDEDPTSPAFLQKLLNQGSDAVGTDQKSALQDELKKSLQNLGLNNNSIDNYDSSSSSGTPLGSNVTTILQNAPSLLLQELGINIFALSDKLRQEIEDQSNAAITAFATLTSEAKAQLLIAIAYGKISPQTGHNVINALLVIENKGATPSTIAQLAATVKNKNELEAKAPIPEDLQTLFRESLHILAPNHPDKAWILSTIDKFADTIRNQQDFYKFSIDFLLDPAKSILKNFSIVTATGSDAQGQTPNIIPV